MFYLHRDVGDMLKINVTFCEVKTEGFSILKVVHIEKNLEEIMLKLAFCILM